MWGSLLRERERERERERGHKEFLSLPPKERGGIIIEFANFLPALFEVCYRQ